MNITFLTKRELEIINRRKLLYPLAIAEKDYFLAIVSKIIYDSPLRDKIIFKGGTALHHCYLDQLRFSEDLDFGSIDKAVTIEEVKTVLEENDFLTVKKEYYSGATIKLEKVQYTGPLGLPNYLKLEIDYIQDVILPAKDLEYQNVWGVETKVKVMDLREICAEKIRAMSDRARYRDFYDLFMIFKNFPMDINKIKELIKIKEIRKPISQKSILANWEIAKQERNGDVEKIYYREGVEDKDIVKFIGQLGIGEIK
ncbi:nucleotidyl transferase AbiEii/AbiGii toxin family protein [bacterium]|nr:MAG: nucleotidyl transferase AbiEii/AbiGii toxin family protein [bacterium]